MDDARPQSIVDISGRHVGIYETHYSEYFGESDNNHSYVLYRSGVLHSSQGYFARALTSDSGKQLANDLQEYITKRRNVFVTHNTVNCMPMIGIVSIYVEPETNGLVDVFSKIYIGELRLQQRVANAVQRIENLHVGTLTQIVKCNDNKHLPHTMPKLCTAHTLIVRSSFNFPDRLCDDCITLLKNHTNPNILKILVSTDVNKLGNFPTPQTYLNNNKLMTLRGLCLENAKTALQ